MPEHSAADSSPHDSELDPLPLSRSPHPYHHHSFDLQQPSECIAPNGHCPPPQTGPLDPSQTAFPALSKESSLASDSGTEADDEHFLKGLPAPRAKLHKGLRGRTETSSGISTPIASPSILQHQAHVAAKQDIDKQRQSDSLRRTRVLLRRITETALVFSLGLMVATNRRASPLLKLWRKGMLSTLQLKFLSDQSQI
ncbi:hypothetical protein CDD82_5581 [Ophiocordyceps australis]|uniref:Uncharacterized protein n=1 Tax=Ophiocordyceps australis TaxID=1399860 RepID=A0A2C5ZT83_9HYPO|nr:hypothetical protein CDD82_5581 [Ophiocordyceps australis]